MSEDEVWIAERAKHLRGSLEPAEVVVWSLLKNRRLAGYRFRRQHVVGRAILDFYCPEKRLAVEVDGPTHIESDDALRDEQLARVDIEVVRIANEDVYRDSAEAMSYVLERLEARPLFNGRRRLT